MRIKTILLTAALTLGALTLTACESQNLLSPKPPDLNKLFTFSASISCETGNFSALFTRTAMGSWDITLTEPYELQGITFSRTKEGIKASLEKSCAFWVKNRKTPRPQPKAASYFKTKKNSAIYPRVINWEFQFKST